MGWEIEYILHVESPRQNKMQVFKFSKDEIRDHINHIYSHFSQLMIDNPDDVYNRFFHTTSLVSIREWFLSLEKDNRYEHHFYLLMIENEPVGFSQISVCNLTGDSDVAISVHERYRGKDGVASCLLKTMLEDSKSLSSQLKVICEKSNTRCRRFFEKFGFNFEYSFDEDCFVGSN